MTPPQFITVDEVISVLTNLNLTLHRTHQSQLEAALSGIPGLVLHNAFVKNANPPDDLPRAEYRLSQPITIMGDEFADWKLVDGRYMRTANNLFRQMESLLHTGHPQYAPNEVLTVRIEEPEFITLHDRWEAWLTVECHIYRAKGH